ncbi:MAG: integrase core domain-containing protein [Methyloceanibacter sp.]
MGIRDKPIAPGSPWQNGFVERLIGSIRSECVDHVIVLGERVGRLRVPTFPSSACGGGADVFGTHLLRQLLSQSGH